ncbi:hypothetical protein J1605_020937 [Eschrichtius robustus]|uniref:Uncharacterized protein n=1 Tax=Eschrichtius robustus TaxID=9764 RepID=A0AB34HI06_ESCRO|nr:hypothetical protein J1605_020937 [Eschrichtius robustus]
MSSTSGKNRNGKCPVCDNSTVVMQENALLGGNRVEIMKEREQGRALGDSSPVSARGTLEAGRRLAEDCAHRWRGEESENRLSRVYLSCPAFPAWPSVHGAERGAGDQRWQGDPGEVGFSADPAPLNPANAHFLKHEEIKA